MHFPDIEFAKKVANELNIPPQPEVLVNVSQEAKNNNPNASVIAEELKRDVSLSSGLLQVVNSPFYGLRNKITSVDHAISLLGIPRMERVVTSIAMRNSVGGKLDLGRFWDSASEIASICCQLARMLSGIDQDDAYSIGLFHDCGIPIMMQRFKNYKKVLTEADKRNVQPRTMLEDKFLKCNHAIVGFCLCEKWFMPQHLSRTVLLHHEDFKTFHSENDDDDLTMSLLSILKMAEHISDCYRQEMRGQNNTEWDNIADDVLSYNNITAPDFEILREDVFEQLAAPD